MQQSKMEEVDKDADLRHPSINTEPRTLDENSIVRATIAASKIYAQHPEPTSDCFIKADDNWSTSQYGQTDKTTHKNCCRDAIDTATRENAPANDGPDALGTQPAEGAPDALGTQPAEGAPDALGTQPAEGAPDALGTQPAEGAPDALGTQLDELVSNAGNVVDTDFTQSKASMRTESTPAAAPPQEPST